MLADLLIELATFLKEMPTLRAEVARLRAQNAAILERLRRLETTRPVTLVKPDPAQFDTPPVTEDFTHLSDGLRSTDTLRQVGAVVTRRDLEPHLR